MKLGHELNLKQTQKLIMTPELRQAISVLQLTSFELENLINNELVNNPLLDREEYSNEKNKDNDDRNDKIEWEKYFENNSYNKIYPIQMEGNESIIEKTIKEDKTLKDHLLLQLHLLDLTPDDIFLGEYIIECINRDGYLDSSIEEICDNTGNNIDKVEIIVNIIQKFYPSGVGARDLKECLLIQLNNCNYCDDCLYIIVEKYLDELANNKFNYIAKELDISPKKVQYIKDTIKTLEPKPGREFDISNDVKYIIPDVYIQHINGEFIININEYSTPRLKINTYYKNLLLNSNKFSQESKFLKSNLNSAIYLIKSIQQRRDTILEIVTKIVEKQKKFFIDGVNYLKPLTLSNIANELEVHESTVSRAIRGKYAQTPQGIYELKYFFKSGFSNLKGQDLSSNSIKEIIKQLIIEEDKKKPISDQRIANILNEKGIDISRRTVAKYRDAINIPSSTKRKRI